MRDEVSYETIFEGRHMRALCFNPDGRNLRVRLNHRRNGDGGFDLPEPQAGAIKAGYANLWLQTAENDYYVNADLPGLRQVLVKFCARFDQVSAVGFSMGGFGAVLLSKSLHLTQAVLISPQRLGFPRTAPFVSEDAIELAAFTTGDQPDLDGISPGLRGIVLFDPFAGKGRDRTYARHLGRIAPGLRLLALPGGGHPATVMLGEAKKFGAFQRATFVDDINPAELRHVHRSARGGSARYEAMIVKYLGSRFDRS